MIVELPWPKSVLSPNTSTHWRKLAQAKKAYKASVAWHLIAAGLRRIDAPSLRLKLTFHPPMVRRHDRDNLVARFKAGFDAIQDVTGIDDHHFTWDRPEIGEVRKGGGVVVEILQGD